MTLAKKISLAITYIVLKLIIEEKVLRSAKDRNNYALNFGRKNNKKKMFEREGFENLVQKMRCFSQTQKHISSYFLKSFFQKSNFFKISVKDLVLSF